jgi:hypothetical protein
VKLELYHRLAEPDSAAACDGYATFRKSTAPRSPSSRTSLRAAELAARGGGDTPALWDGARLHVGLEAVRAALSAAARP